jgi:hypothetical protein
MFALGNLLVNVLSIGQSFACSNPAEYVGFLGAIKILNTTLLGGEVKPAVPSCKFYFMLKNVTSTR